MPFVSRSLLRSPRLVAAAAAFAAALPACDGCSHEPKVPFKLGGEDAGNEPALERVADAESRAYESAVDRPKIDGKEIPVDFVRALLAHDLDGDGDRDALLLVHDTVQRLRLVASMRDDSGYQAPTDVAGFTAPGDASCTTSSASLSAIARDKGVLQVALACGDPPRPMPDSLTVLSLEAPPRVYERFEVAGDKETALLSLSLAGKDVDGDGHTDLLLRVARRAEGDADAALELTWFDRASGLSRDVREPETTFAAWASLAREQLPKKPEKARVSAERTLFFENALCRERGAPALIVSGAPGITCGRSAGAASALVTKALADAREKHVADALADYAELAARGQLPSGKPLERLMKALSSLPRREGISLRQGPSAQLVTRPPVHLPSARFISETRLLVHRTQPILYDLERAEELPVNEVIDDLIRDPSGQFLVEDVEREACGGARLRIERAKPPGTPYVHSPAVSTPPITEHAPCAEAGGSSFADSPYHVLGWAPQGVVLSHGREAVIVPLDVQGMPASAPFALPEGSPLPAPLPSGQASPDGARYAELSPAGVLVFQRGADPELWRPDGFGAIALNAREVAISPSGRHVAVVADGTVYVLTRD